MTNPFDRQGGSRPDFLTDEEVAAGRPATRSAGGAGQRAGRVAEQRKPRVSRARRSPFEPPADSSDPEPDPREVARTIVLQQLTMAPRSRKQLRDKLLQRGCPDDVADEVLDRLTDVGLVDDAAYAAMLVRSQQATRGLAKRALSQELRRKGIDDELARETLDEVDDESERDRARALAEKKMRSMHGLDVQVQTRRLAGMLARKGYSSGIAWQVIREVIADAPEHQLD